MLYLPETPELILPPYYGPTRKPSLDDDWLPERWRSPYEVPWWERTEFAVARGNTQSATATSATPTVNKPTGMTDGGIIVFSLVASGGSLTGQPTNVFTEAAITGISNPHHWVFSKYISTAASEPATYGFTLGTSIGHSIQATFYSGQAANTLNATVFEAIATATDATTNVSAVAPTITTTTDNCMLVGGAGGNSSTTTWTGPGGGWTEVYDPGAGRSHCFYSDATKTPAGAVGTTTFTQSAARANTAWQAAIAPAGAGGGTKAPPPSVMRRRLLDHAYLRM